MTCRLTVRLLALMLASCRISDAFAQTPPPPLPAPTQFSTQTTCLVNCGTQAGNCRQSCTSPTFTASRQTPGQDSGAGTQCILGCSNSEILCEQSCGPR